MSSCSNFKHDLFVQFARVGKALSNANRLVLLEYIAQRECSVEAPNHRLTGEEKGFYSSYTHRNSTYTLTLQVM